MSTTLDRILLGGIHHSCRARFLSSCIGTSIADDRFLEHAASMTQTVRICRYLYGLPALSKSESNPGFLSIHIGNQSGMESRASLTRDLVALKVM